MKRTITLLLFILLMTIIDGYAFNPMRYSPSDFNEKFQEKFEFDSKIKNVP